MPPLGHHRRPAARPPDVLSLDTPLHATNTYIHDAAGCVTAVTTTSGNQIVTVYGAAGTSRPGRT